MRSPLLAPIAPTSHKYSRGKVGIIAGSRDYPGAAVLCVGGARRGGAGYITFLNQDEQVTQLIHQSYPDVVAVRTISDTDTDALVIGPGNPRVGAIPFSPFTILDSSAMKLAAKVAWDSVTILTPHEGEARELGFDPSDRVQCALTMAEQLKSYVVLKGAQTVIASRSGLIHVDAHGTPDLSTAGTGDILAGLLASMLASWQPDSDEQIMEVLSYAVQAHGLAGKYAAKRNQPVVATDVLKALPKIFLKD